MGKALWKGFFSLLENKRKVTRATYITRIMLGRNFVVENSKEGKDVLMNIKLKNLNKKFGEFILTRKKVIHKKKRKKKK